MRALSALTLLFLSASTWAYEAGSVVVKGGLANVDPDASSSALALDGAAIAGSEADVEDNTQLGLTITYHVTDWLGLQLLASTPFEHDISADTGVLGLGTVDAGSTKHLPPTLTALYFPPRPPAAGSLTSVQASTGPSSSRRTSLRSSRACSVGATSRWKTPWESLSRPVSTTASPTTCS